MTYIDGIAASENIDTSGERIVIAGMDISSLATEGTFTYEHEMAITPDGQKLNIKLPQMTVGKILKAKKIFSEADCEDEREKYYWEKIKIPYIYVMGELFDDYTDAAKDLAGKFKYDADHKDQNERNVMNFSIEGRYIKKEGIDVTRSIARKCTISVTPANKAAGAEMIPGPKKTDNSDELFKTESVAIELIKSETIDAMKKHADILGLKPLAKNVIPMKKPAAPTTPAAPKALGQTKSGKDVHTHMKIHEYQGFSAQDHMDAADTHYNAARATKDPKMGQHHLNRMNLHRQASITAGNKENRFAAGQNKAKDKAMTAAQPKLFRFNKSDSLGSGNAAPSTLTGQAALAKESIKKPKEDKKWLKKAEQLYQEWEQKSLFEEFLKNKIPSLTKGEIESIGQAMILKSTLEAEQALSKFIKKK